MKQETGFWSKTVDETLRSLEVSPDEGLSSEEVQKRLTESGANRLVQERKTTFWRVFREEVTEPMILLLLVVGVVYSVWGKLEDAITIFAIILVLVLVEIFTEYRAKKAVAALRKLAPPTVSVLRDGKYQRVPSWEVVPGDILVLGVGERVPADARIITSLGLEADESALTGESMPVAKEERALPPEIALAERTNTVFAGTTSTRGRGKAVVTATGMSTELGRITGLVLEAKEPKTPFQLAMKQLAGFLVWVAVFFSVLIPLIGILQGKPYREMILTGLSLSFATIPEELPIIVTMILGVGAYALSRKNVLIRRLRAVETLGSVTVIATDKTGTLTENRMALARVVTDSASRDFNPSVLSPGEKSLLELGVLTSSINHVEGAYRGDPAETALLEAAKSAGVSPEGLQRQYTLEKEFGFDNERKMMSVVYSRGGERWAYAKGAPEVILEISSKIARDGSERLKTGQDEAEVKRQIELLAGEGMRVMALAYKRLDDASLTQQEAENGLVFAGLVGLGDPPRPEVREALAVTREAGVRTIVVSGDHPLTVKRVAAEVGIDTAHRVLTGTELARLSDEELKKELGEVSLFARTTPEQKLRLVKLLQESGEVVAVTGDGINDAPALKSADIGIAMGETGTEVAREAAGMVLTDDSFTSIAAGVREGRKIHDNLRKGVTYYLAVKVALVLSFLVPLALGIPFPFAPIQIVLLELFMDLAASATFVAEGIEPDALRRRPPRGRQARFIDRGIITNISWGSISLAAVVLTNYLLAWYGGRSPVEAQTVAFATWLVGHVFLALTMRSHRESLLKLGLFSNRVMVVWAVAVVFFLMLVTYLPFAQSALRVAPLSPGDWLLTTGVPLAMLFWLELKKVWLKG
ncbi:MAG: cation-transporting P-type ATPase [Chloroflexota bacterium]